MALGPSRAFGAALDAGAIPIVIGQNSPCGSYAIAKPIAERTAGKVGMISLDTHWDAKPIDWLTKDARIAGSGNWKTKTYEFHDNFSIPNLVEIGERGMLEAKEIVRHYLERGAHFIPMWKVRTELGIDGLCGELRHAYDGADAVYSVRNGQPGADHTYWKGFGAGTAVGLKLEHLQVGQ